MHSHNDDLYDVPEGAKFRRFLVVLGAVLLFLVFVLPFIPLGSK